MEHFFQNIATRSAIVELDHKSVTDMTPLTDKNSESNFRDEKDLCIETDLEYELYKCNEILNSDSVNQILMPDLKSGMESTEDDEEEFDAQIEKSFTFLESFSTVDNSSNDDLQNGSNGYEDMEELQKNNDFSQQNRNFQEFEISSNNEYIDKDSESEVKIANEETINRVSLLKNDTEYIHKMTIKDNIQDEDVSLEEEILLSDFITVDSADSDSEIESILDENTLNANFREGDTLLLNTSGDLDFEAENFDEIELNIKDDKLNSCDIPIKDDKLNSGDIHIKDDKLNSGENLKKKTIDYFEDEKEDITHSDWQAIKILSTNEERYKQVRNCWQSKTIPDPNKNLTYHSYRKRRFKNDISDSRTIKQHKRHASSSLPGRSAKRSCTFLIDQEIDSLTKTKKQKKQEIFSEMHCKINDVDQQCSQIENQLQNRPYDYSYDRNTHMQLNSRISIITAEYNKIADDCEHSFKGQICALKERRNEVLKFYNFYKGLNDSQEEDPTLLTETQFQELDEIQNIYNQFNYYYRN